MLERRDLGMLFAVIDVRDACGMHDVTGAGLDYDSARDRAVGEIDRLVDHPVDSDFMAVAKADDGPF